MAITINADSGAPGSPLHHHWSVCVGAGRAAEGLRASWQEQLRVVKENCGFRYVRFHGLFHDDMFVLTSDGGYNFQYVDDVFDRMLDAGVRPFVELSFSPGALARDETTVFWWGAHSAPPASVDAWSDLIRATVRHWIGRYGADEVRQWYFEVWNEPNLPLFFRGTQQEYFALYAATARTIKEIDAGLRVGGPASSAFVRGQERDWEPVWVEAFLRWCRDEGVPADFVSTHPYPTDWALDDHSQATGYSRPADATPGDLATLRDIVKSGPYPDAEIHLTEWNSSPSPRDHAHDRLPAATFVVRANLESAGLTDSLSYWTFTDVFEEGGAGDTVFHGGFGLVNYQGIVKPAFHAYRFLHLLGDEILERVPGAVVTRRSGKLSALAYHYPPEEPRTVPDSRDTPSIADATAALGTPDTLDITLTGLSPGARFTLETLDSEHGNAVAAWRAMGSPQPPDRAQTAALRAAARATRREDLIADGTLRVRRPIDPWSVVVLTQS
jgi:xylan 1,4-beta-xylosidase